MAEWVLDDSRLLAEAKFMQGTAEVAVTICLNVANRENFRRTYKALPKIGEMEEVFVAKANEGKTLVGHILCVDNDVRARLLFAQAELTRNQDNADQPIELVPVPGGGFVLFSKDSTRNIQTLTGFVKNVFITATHYDDIVLEQFLFPGANYQSIPRVATMSQEDLLVYLSSLSSTRKTELMNDLKQYQEEQSYEQGMSM